MSTISKEQLYGLVDALPESERGTAARVLEALAALGSDAPRYTIETAPLDDEPETEEERAAVAEARAELARGEGIPAAAIYRDFGM
ncbi:MAG: hypothetical protein M3Q65_25570 [Chloroflexota bacterium]|nr:hypothetical protein [Chloroflexota bacterium]